MNSTKCRAHSQSLDFRIQLAIISSIHIASIQRSGVVERTYQPSYLGMSQYLIIVHLPTCLLKIRMAISDRDSYPTLHLARVSGGITSLEFLPKARRSFRVLSK